MNTREQVTSLQSEISELESQIAYKRRSLANIYTSCFHNWSNPEYIPEHIPSYTILGDEPGTMGVDFRGPTYVPSQTIRRWSRRCRNCGLTQTSERTKMVHKTRGISGTVVTEEEPVFP
jgi:hypothetical protein